ncbi:MULTISPECIES: thermonuclease family protein [Rhodobacterales]|uniref:Thermonuclease family protein n=2 Tax=Alphaproteobacteria TaxID=28211 RepID=A0A9Q2RZK9_9RHOB|nr:MULTISPECIES: thermonuclease family protein [Rhodobacterales]MBM1222763.1 thermonuclease family protein [Ponticoccus sp. SC6-9]MBM1236262.1 thermonuclease family protein [Ponticoccus sp. SC6-45]MBM1240712.1 thermonuclease family protein [Ponticoccus sp. SC6-49]MBM1254204.1 thermonuclease family protein [Ponticoccus sp. SC6-33]MBM1281256.1 thermonuclease family protein [Ponticoccus sp. SC6-36]MBM1294901.1 thermonuclease family protein [Ponticoccus sp. SC6-11]MBM1308229.1 thermonuclease fam
MFGVAATGAMIVAALLSIDTGTAAEPINPASVYVIDGDTIDLGGERFRLVGLDTPETYDPQCAYEKALGDEATRRLRELIGSGELVELIVLPGRDRNDRGLARLYIGRADVAGILIGEGLAREYNGGRRQGWC